METGKHKGPVLREKVTVILPKKEGVYFSKVDNRNIRYRGMRACFTLDITGVLVL